MSDLPITAVDIVVLAVLLISAIAAFVRGFVHEVLAIGAWVGALLATLYGFGLVQPYARDLVAIPLLADIGAGVVLFLLVLILLSIVTRVLAARVRGSALGALDRSLGLAFGVARGALVLALAWLVLVWALPRAEDRPDWVQAAKSRRLIESGAGVLARLAPEGLVVATGSGRAAPTQGDGGGDNSEAAGPTYESLSQPAPKVDAPESQNGYKDGSRSRMDRLIENQIGGDEATKRDETP
mgnify:CR=1 FL=1